MKNLEKKVKNSTAFSFYDNNNANNNNNNNVNNNMENVQENSVAYN
jgi:hypothetical protein